MNKLKQASIAKAILIERLNQNFDHAIMLSGKAVNQAVPCFVGSEKHLEQIIKIAEDYAVQLLKVSKTKGRE